MRQLLVRRLKSRRSHVLAAWEALLRSQRVSTPLANPDIFAHEMGTTFDAVIAQLSARPACRRPVTLVRSDPWPPPCPCGRNPFLSYYLTAEEVLDTTLAQLQAQMCQRRLDQQMAERAVLRQVIRRLGRRDIEGFGALCQSCPNARCGHFDRPCPRANLVALRGVADESAVAAE